MSIYFWCFCYLYIQDSTESAQVCERGGQNQKGPRAGTLSRITQSTTTLYAQGSWF